MARNVTRAYRRIQRNRRRAAVRRIVLALSAVCLVIMLGFALTGFISSADTADYDTGTKYFTSVEIEQGDTIWTLAENYIDYHYDSTREYVSEVVSINGLRDADDIVAGEHIILPYWD